MDALLDSGADGTAYGPKDLPKKHNLKVTKLDIPIDITTAGNGKHSITTIAKDVPYSIQGFSGKMDILIMPVHMDQLVLGNHWLSAINPQIDWKEKELIITQGDVIHTLRVDPTKKAKPLTKINFLLDSKDFKAEEGDEIFLLHTREDVQEALGIDDEFYAKKREKIQDEGLEALLDEYTDVFREELPRDKPTKRNVEHTIPLVDRAQPIQAHQY